MIGILLVVSAALSGSPSVFKCTDANGVVVFSQQPCGKDAKAVDTSAALRVPSDIGASMTEALSRSVDRSQLEIDCANRQSAVIDGSSGELRSTDAEIAYLHRYQNGTPNNAAGAARDAQAETRINGLEAKKARILDQVRQQQTAVENDCAAKRDALAKAAQAQPPAPPPKRAPPDDKTTKNDG